jgi:hypothetical protein
MACDKARAVPDGHEICESRQLASRFAGVGSQAASELQRAIRCERPGEVGSDHPFDGESRFGSTLFGVDLKHDSPVRLIPDV